MITGCETVIPVCISGGELLHRCIREITISKSVKIREMTIKFTPQRRKSVHANHRKSTKIKDKTRRRTADLKIQPDICRNRNVFLPTCTCSVVSGTLNPAQSINQSTLTITQRNFINIFSSCYNGRTFIA